MIGVAADDADAGVVEEFFELFKTAWEPAVRGRAYEVVLATTECAVDLDAAVLLLYGSRERAAERQAAIAIDTVSGPHQVNWAEWAFPLYGPAGVFTGGIHASVITCGGRALEYQHRSGRRIIRRVGYDLFDEIQHLLSRGQPVSEAATPTLELHIALLRTLLLDAGVSFVEIPPRPAGHDFVGCLTHDVDFFGIRRHGLDRTLAGFLARASFGTLADVFRGRRPARDVIRNWGALVSLPFVWLGLARDIWQPFEDYARAEEGRPTTFFLVPFKGRIGVGPDGAIQPSRAVPYEVQEISAEVKNAHASGAEMAVHGIDAWRDAEAGRAELKQVTSLTRRPTAGVRMHWLYFGPDSPAHLETAGFDYDSTWGYNDAVGYRAGTSQVFRLPGTKSLMELPMSIMDSALFYADRMGLTGDAALNICRRIIGNAMRFGGTVVLNWHCRSLAPERLWGGMYQQLLAEIGEHRRAWFATAQETVDWFRWRRSIRFTRDTVHGAITVAANAGPGPAATVRIHRPADATRPVEEISFDGHQTLRVVL